MNKIPDGTQIDGSYVLDNNLIDRLVLSFDGLKLDLSQVIEAKTGVDGFVKFCDWPNPVLENGEVVHYVKKSNVEAYIVD